MPEMNSDNLLKECRKIIECDTARIKTFDDGKMFLIIGYNKNTKDDPGQWVEIKEDGTKIERDWDYTQEQTVASGNSEEELLEYTRLYKKCIDNEKKILETCNKENLPKEKIKLMIEFMEDTRRLKDKYEEDLESLLKYV